MRLLPLLVLLAACSPGADLTRSLALPVALYDAEPERTDLDQLTYLGGVELSHPDNRFGGFSALGISADGTRLIAVSDSAYWMTARFGWSETYGTFSVGDIAIAPILSRDGRPLDGAAADSEALAFLGNGVYAVSFERDHRINTYALGDDWGGLDSVGVAFPAPPGASGFSNNGGMEGLTALPGGRLLAGVEDGDGGSHALWTRDGDTWREAQLAAEPDYGLTALDYHDGAVYALERFWQTGIGNRIRILRFDAGALEAGGQASIQPELLGTLEAGKAVDNFEGLAVLEHDGRTILLMVSDDNYNRAQRTLVLAFAVN